ncbi:MAG: hypothetical protein B6U75_02825 [Desulfurococcales archaeon ex4484_217_1]|nr:MAG: hypothetical protein B6U75_02825 [Desulfurococcales archaeon ex4484_217_1]
MKESLILRMLSIIVASLSIILPLSVPLISCFKSSTTYIIAYNIEIETEKETVVNIPLPPKLSWQSLIAILNETYSGGIIERDYSKYVLRVSTSNKFNYRANIEVLVRSIYGEKDIFHKLNVPMKTLIRSHFGLEPSTYYSLTSPTYWWNYSIDEVQNSLEEFYSLYNYSSRNDILEDTLINVLMKLRDYVSRKLTYRPVTKGRLGIRDSLLGNYGDCSEYSDVFITFARALGIPSLRCIGFVIRGWNSQLGEYSVVGHAWPIIYVNDLGWLPFEVTVAPEYLKAKPGETSLKYICLLIDHGNVTRESLDLARDILFDPSEKWVPGSSSSLIINSVKIKFQISIKPKPQIPVSFHAGEYENVFASTLFFTFALILYFISMLSLAFRVKYG